ncbi:hypothetical protein EK21DRAFT_87414 [Setomelanomma holmii]|uniref:Uncharacterized protein n=1 Tax=Setomelanomma holmii TaxID=210430 RepID=A0A9P4HE01_9PLEO|nr:hypothetical protein EK21DRAFT_87414 [Setomelanomma holmii]
MTTDKSVQFSAREMEVLALAWQCMESQPKIDMEKLAKLTGYTFKSAGVSFGNIKRKLKLLGEGLSADGPATPKNGRAKTATTSKSTGKKRAKGSDEDEVETPSKRPKKSTRKRNDDDDDDED